MNVLVTYASKHGSTAQIADVIRNDLRMAGFDVALQPADEVTNIDEYDAVILGSAIYVGQWQQAVTDLINRFAETLKTKQVWLFSSGPIGDDPFPKEMPPITEELIEKTGAVEHQSFLGKLDRSTLGFGERLITTVLRAPEGDFRDWDAIRAWADYIGRTLRESSVRSAASTD